MKHISTNLSLFSLFTSIIVLILSYFQLIAAIRTSASGNDALLRTTRKPDYSDVYEKIDDNDIFKNIRRIMRIGDPANGVPVMAPFKRDHQYYSDTENELGNVEHQRVEGLDQFVTKSSLIYSNHEKFDFSLLWPKVTFISRHSSTRNYRVFYSNYTFVGCTLKGEADVQRTSIEDNCYKLKELRLTLHFKNYDVNVVTTSNNEQDKEIARTAKQTLDRWIKQEYTLGLEKPAYELEQKIKEYFGSYRCLLQDEPPVQRPSRKNDRDDRAFIDFDRIEVTERPFLAQQGRPVNDERERGYDNRPQQGNSRPLQNNYDRDQSINRQPPNSSANDDRRPSTSTHTQNDHRNPYNQYESNTPKPNSEPIYFPSNDNRDIQPTYNSNTHDTQLDYSRNRQVAQTNQAPYYPQSNRDITPTTTTRQTIQNTQRTVVPSRNRPVTSIQTSIQTQTSVYPVYRTTKMQSRTTTQPPQSYYDSSRII